MREFCLLKITTTWYRVHFEESCQLTLVHLMKSWNLLSSTCACYCWGFLCNSVFKTGCTKCKSDNYLVWRFWLERVNNNKAYFLKVIIRNVLLIEYLDIFISECDAWEKWEIRIWNALFGNRAQATSQNVFIIWIGFLKEGGSQLKSVYFIKREQL